LSLQSIALIRGAGCGARQPRHPQHRAQSRSVLARALTRSVSLLAMPRSLSHMF